MCGTMRCGVSGAGIMLERRCCPSPLASLGVMRAALGAVTIAGAASSRLDGFIEAARTNHGAQKAFRPSLQGIMHAIAGWMRERGLHVAGAGYQALRVQLRRVCLAARGCLTQPQRRRSCVAAGFTAVALAARKAAAGPRSGCSLARRLVIAPPSSHELKLCSSAMARLPHSSSSSSGRGILLLYECTRGWQSSRLSQREQVRGSSSDRRRIENCRLR